MNRTGNFSGISGMKEESPSSLGEVILLQVLLCAYFETNLNLTNLFSGRYCVLYDYNISLILKSNRCKLPK
jgi:hypothetical protein